MPVQEILKALGSWEIKLLPSTPREVLDALDYFGHVAIVPGRLDPLQYGDNLLTPGTARYVGVLRTRTIGDDGRTNTPQDDLSVGGVGMAFWLGDEDGKGDVYENAVAPASASFATTINMLLPASGAVTAGTIYPVPGQYTGRHQYESPRKAITYVTDTFSTPSVPVSWRVNSNATLDAGPDSNLFVVNPTCVITSKDAGEDMSLRALPGSVDVTRDVEDYTTRVVLLAEGEGSSIATGAADITPATGYKDLHGNPLKLTRLVSESDTATANAATRAQLALSQFTSTRNALSLSTTDYDVHGSFVVGDRVWVYDPDSGLIDPTTEITFRGQRINPMKLQVTETSWAITSQYTVAYRTADGTWLDLTQYVDWETDATSTVTVGDFSRQLTNTGSEPVGSRPNADTSIPGQPVLVTPFAGSAYLDGRGFTRARVVVSWNAPLNTDGSTIIDGDHYEIRYAVDTDMIYPATWSQISQVRWQDLQIWAQPFAAPSGRWQTMVVRWDTTSAQLQDLSPGIGYDVQIRAVDTTGNAGAWSPVTTFVASSDNIPPSTPAAPTVAGSRIAVQVTHQLGRSTGGTFNLESDLDHLEIHVSYEPTFTPDITTLKGKAPANAGMIQAQIPVVFTAQVEETTARYVRVVAVDKTGNKSGPSDAATATALLIDDAHISDLTVSKVTAGTIAASWVMAGEIKTADVGARARISAAGYELYNTAGDRTFFADASTGDVSIIGKLVSGASGFRLEVNPASTLPEMRFYPSSGSNYAFINSFPFSTIEAALGLASSSYDAGGVDAHSRVLLTGNGAFMQTVRTDTQATYGGFVRASSGSFLGSYNKASVDGGLFYADELSARAGWNPSDSNANYFNFASGKTYHIGQWENYATPSTTQGIFMGTVLFGAATSASVTYGVTLASNVIPVATCVSGNFGSATPTVWGIQSFTTTQFTMAWNNSQGMRINFLCHRTN
ncbi:fibronectin type III domain-containing protein [Streptomyces longwoodensis]|uniref:fibronectin type III domain-containing protein n=1 Tax=Streptomyces longwoodensis TaxID=68231 RepID=UPI002DDAB9A1|nr:fibronectin type III domain-containing protein [Streptomyces longwoodensis]WRY87408.1 fibronectin type III domain-containing protein [Streptomyces longwoodensis]